MKIHFYNVYTLKKKKKKVYTISKIKSMLGQRTHVSRCSRGTYAYAEHHRPFRFENKFRTVLVLFYLLLIHFYFFREK